MCEQHNANFSYSHYFETTQTVHIIKTIVLKISAHTAIIHDHLNAPIITTSFLTTTLLTFTKHNVDHCLSNVLNNTEVDQNLTRFLKTKLL